MSEESISSKTARRARERTRAKYCPPRAIGWPQTPGQRGKGPRTATEVVLTADFSGHARDRQSDVSDARTSVLRKTERKSLAML
jgi:hypothetical protein